MTPRSIETGRGLDAIAFGVDVPVATATLLAKADGARVAVSIAVGTGVLTEVNSIVSIGVLVGGGVIPLTALTLGHPVCYLSVDKLGSLVTQDIWALHGLDDVASLGVSTVRQTQPWSEE